MIGDSQRFVPMGPDGPDGGPQPTSAFVIRALLSSRVEVGLPSDGEPDEHDVNIYLTHLLCAYVEPGFHQRIAAYLAPHESTLFERVQNTKSARFRYRMYRVNADHLLMSIGVFQNPAAERAHALPAPLRPADEVYVGRGKAYYDYASTYGGSIFGRQSAVPEVLGKLSAHFEKYVRILGHMRTEYLNFVQRLGEGEIYHLDQESRERGLAALRDEFLDALSAHRHAPTAETRARLDDVAAHLRRLDPQFKFDADAG